MVVQTCEAPGGGRRGQHLILYDGVCLLCNRMSRFVLARDQRGAFDFASLQSATGRAILQRFGKDAQLLSTFYVVTDYRSQSAALLAEGHAVLFVIENLRIGGKWSRMLRILPKSLLDLGYELVARNRYRLFGRMDSCFLPSEEFKKRFIDV